jgi:Predicted ATPase (AAA+ superfamily)
MNDLSLEKIDSDYKIINSTLDGSIQNQPKNIILYVTSNRRHLMPRDMIENERSSAIHTDESVEEKISLSDRFGLWIGFHNLSQDDFIKIIKKYCEVYNLEFNDNIKKISIRWSLQRGNRTGRSAWQFILNYAAEQNKKISF